MYEVDFYRRDDGKWAWRVTHANGNVVATDGGQGYEKLSAAHDALLNLAVSLLPMDVNAGYVAAGGTL